VDHDAARCGVQAVELPANQIRTITVRGLGKLEVAEHRPWPSVSTLHQKWHVEILAHQLTSALVDLLAIQVLLCYAHSQAPFFSLLCRLKGIFVFTMVPTPAHLEAFAPLEWALPHLKSPDWIVSERDRGVDPIADIFNRETIRANDGVQYWLELHPKPAPGAAVERTVSLVKYGNGLSGFPGTVHGGALLTLMDEALAYVMVANQVGAKKTDFASLGNRRWKELHQQGRPPSEVLEGWYVTAKMDIKFLKPVLCPGVVGIETELLENTGRRMKMRAVMKDGKGTPLLQADGTWVQIGGAAKL
jgi:acyl-coenzyme A thioesterase PaaI-like protein